MLKNILKLEGAQKLTRNEQKSIKGAILAEKARIWCACNQVSLGWMADAEACMTACKNMQ